MIILDTDVLTLVQRVDRAEGLRVRSQILQLPTDETLGTTVVTYEEQMRGWLARMGQVRTTDAQVEVYQRLLQHIANYRQIQFVLPFGRASGGLFDDLRHRHPRLGKMDLRIAAIAIRHDALLVTRNLNDFAKISKLRVEDWTKP